MKRRNYLLTLLSVAVITSASAQKETPPAGGAAKDFKLSDKTNAAYPNGLKTTTVHYGELPKVTVSLIIKTGNVHEGANETWLADLTGRMMREGTATMKFADIAKKAATMGGSFNVNVGQTQTTISGSVLSEYAPDFIKLLADIVMHPAFPSSELERLKNDFKRRLATEKTVPQNLAEEAFYQAMYKDHPYGRYFPTEEMLNSFTEDMVKDFYNKNFGAKRSVLYVVGKFDEAAVNAAVKATLAQWKAGPEVAYPPVPNVPATDTVLLDRKAAPQTTLMIGMPVVTPTNKDYVPMLVTNSLLGGSFGSRITSNIRENKGYTYSPYSLIDNYKGSSLWYEQADVTSEHTVDALLEIEKEIKRLQMEPPAQDELAGIQNYEAGIFVLRNSTPNGIIGQLNFLDLYGLDDSYLNNYVQNIYKVTPEMVKEMTQNYIQYDKMVKVMVGDKEAIDKQVEKQKSLPKAF